MDMKEQDIQKEERLYTAEELKTAFMEGTESYLCEVYPGNQEDMHRAAKELTEEWYDQVKKGQDYYKIKGVADNTMKRFLIFIGSPDFCQGGMGDYLASSDTIKGCKQIIIDEMMKNLLKDNPGATKETCIDNEWEFNWEDTWINIYDTVKGKIIWERWGE